MTNSKRLKKNCKNNFLAYIAPSAILIFYRENKCTNPFFYKIKKNHVKTTII